MDKPIEKEEEKENEIYLHPEYDECGRPYYNLPNARKEENLIAVCLKYASKVIPVIFLPGVMGSNLKSKHDDEPVWLVNSQLGVAGWISKDASYRKRTLDPQNHRYLRFGRNK
ncbi:hypothetical protein [Photorhabdus temperata]|uniref:hypothetical protein n=1 Tax=Photorhabdus temperata TaxID=574560 RepID=UPI000420857F|nr:hypothetical protein [Photorhabdus temperata]